VMVPVDPKANPASGAAVPRPAPGSTNRDGSIVPAAPQGGQKQDKPDDKYLVPQNKKD
jgi:hypothetical protein